VEGLMEHWMLVHVKGRHAPGIAADGGGAGGAK